MVNIKSEPQYKKAEKIHVQEVDTELSRELELYLLNNNEGLYHGVYTIARHYLAKLHLKYGYLGQERAISYITNFVVESTIRVYRKNNDLPRVNRETKEHLATRLFEVLKEEIDFTLKEEDHKEIKKSLAYDDYRRIERALAELRQH